jgi:hypothetical protein
MREGTGGAQVEESALPSSAANDLGCAGGYSPIEKTILAAALRSQNQREAA